MRTAPTVPGLLLLFAATSFKQVDAKKWKGGTKGGKKTGNIVFAAVWSVIGVFVLYGLVRYVMDRRASKQNKQPAASDIESAIPLTGTELESGHSTSAATEEKETTKKYQHTPLSWKDRFLSIFGKKS